MAAKENGLGWIRAEFSEVVTFVGLSCRHVPRVEPVFLDGSVVDHPHPISLLASTGTHAFLILWITAGSAWGNAPAQPACPRS